ncbi:flagellar transcriptional regulator FlhD [Paraburkholderia fungorum]|uniref:flagellar transcriptional regulator FlhD n=1 Tax=Paraburkholderia fungorum TaxID=134537 RepID=UPI00160A3F6D|nr:flagellar transcriptional regulator FlhD [Paraburkholderia fungorum]MBB5547473.1 flagellar transcriptional activator FlhD [Paraburkholderia fungorum]
MSETSSGDMVTEIREVNLAYLLLVQRLIREDRPMAMFRLGVSVEIADILASLTLAQTVKIAASNNLLCQFRLEDHSFLSALVDKGRGTGPAQMHAAILLAGQPAEEFR